MFDFLFSLAPWYVWLLAFLAALVFVYVQFGRNAALALLATLGPLILFMLGRKGGREDVKEEIKDEIQKQNSELVERVNDAGRDADVRNLDPERLRDDDGAKRHSVPKRPTGDVDRRRY